MSASIEQVLEGTSICICAGSGGVGKTTTSAAIAAGMAARGMRVAVLTIDPAKRLADSLGLVELGNEERQVDPELFRAAGVDPGDGELWALMLDAKATFDDVVSRYSADAETRDRILDNRIYAQISGALAGSQEYMAMEKLYEIHERGDYDLLVLDTPPSRNALDFLDAPQRVVQFVEGRTLRLFLAPAGLAARIAHRGTSAVLAVLRRLIGLTLLDDLSEFFDATAGLVDGFRDRANRVSELLGDERTRFLIVCGPAAEPIEEALHLRGRMEEQDLPLGGLVVNRVHVADPVPGDPGLLQKELTRLIDDPDLVERILSGYADERALAGRDAHNIDELIATIGDEPLIRIPEQGDEVHDLAGLLALGPHLFGEADPQATG